MNWWNKRSSVVTGDEFRDMNVTLFEPLPIPIAHCREASEVPLNTISRLQPSALPISDITDRNALLRPLQAGWQWQAPHGDADQGYQGAPPVSIQFEQASSIRLLSFKF